jgi:GNAT superfamily N-acetyltransferase
MNIKVFKARKKNSKDIIKLINELAQFEKLEPPDGKAKKRLIKDAFGKNPLFYVIAARDEKNIVAYAFYFFTYSSFLARKTLYLEDIFISENYRGRGIGKILMNELIKIAKKQRCGRMEWCVLNWNINAINFYEKLGAKELKDWNYYRLETDNFDFGF